MSDPILISAPSLEPVTLAEACMHLRIDASDTSEDSLITSFITAARLQAEHELNRKLITQTWDVPYDAFPAAGESIRIAPSLAPVQSIVQVAYLDTTAVVRTVSAANYLLDAAALPGYVFPMAGYSWPADVADSANAVKVRVTCGYGSLASDVPRNVWSWMLLQIGAMYRNREAFSTGAPVAALPNQFTDRLLDPHRVWLMQ